MRFLMLVLFGALISLSSACYSLDQHERADEFWADFRQSVVDRDYESIADMTRFPFETRGVADWMPIVSYDRGEFVEVLPALLEQPIAPMDSDTSGEFVAMHQLIRETEKLTPEHITSDTQIRVGDFEMRRTSDGWRFVFAYFDGPTEAE